MTDDALQAKRSQAIVAYAVALVALGRENGLGAAAVANWVHRKYAERGFFDQLRRRIGSGNVAAVASEIASGRRLIHRDVHEALGDGTATISARTDWSDLQAQCFYYDCDAEEMYAFFDETLHLQGRRLGVSFAIERSDDTETLRLARAPVSDAEVRVRAATREDVEWIVAFLRRRWGSEIIAESGATYDASAAPALIAELGAQRVGLATYRFSADECHLLTLDAEPPGGGVGALLVARIKAAAREHGRTSVSLITTNDNLPALGFYQRNGFALAELRPGAVTEARKRKPSIPMTGFKGIPVRDELKLVWTA
jgi:N-acetylglutamate synthase-like GNAT family acetyltransferase